jgi:hypothetical protein
MIVIITLILSTTAFLKISNWKKVITQVIFVQEKICVTKDCIEAGKMGAGFIF